MTHDPTPAGFQDPGVPEVTLSGAGGCRGAPREGLGSPVEAGGGPGAGAPALAKDELICVHRALMLSLSLAPGGSISGTGRSGKGGGQR